MCLMKRWSKIILYGWDMKFLVVREKHNMQEHELRVTKKSIWRYKKAKNYFYLLHPTAFNLQTMEST